VRGKQLLSIPIAALLFMFPSSLPHAGKGAPVALTLAVDVAYGPHQGPESFREELERQLIRESRGAGCFTRTIPARGAQEDEADLLLRVVIRELVQQTDHDLSITQRGSTYGPADESRRLTAKMEAEVDLQLLLLPESRSLRQRGFKAAEAYRPRMNEDPAYEVQLQMLDSIARSCRKFVCKGGVNRLRREIGSSRLPQ